MFAVNKYGRDFVPGKSISVDFRETVISALLQKGATGALLHFKGRYRMAKEVRKQLLISTNSVINYVEKYCIEGIVKSKRTGGDRRSMLNSHHIAVIEHLLEKDPTLTYQNIYEKLQEQGIVQETGMKSIAPTFNIVQKKLNFTREHHIILT